MRYALRKLAEVVESSVPIVVRATWEPLPENYLGLSGAWYRRLIGGFAEDGMWFPDALANDILEGDQNLTTPEMYIKLNSDASDWYFGTDGNPPTDEVDFAHVVMHEVLHGLAFGRTFNVVKGEGSWGIGDDNETPLRYEFLVENGAGQALVSTFANPSEELADELTSEDLFFGGPNATAANRGDPPALYAPPTWSPSATAHFDDSFYGTQDELMTRAYVPTQLVGPVIRGVLADVGYFVAHARKISLDDKKHLSFTGKVTVPLGYPGCRSNIEVVVQRLRQGNWVNVASKNTEGNGDFKVGVPDRASRYRAKIKRQHKGYLNVNDCLAATSDTVTHRH